VAITSPAAIPATGNGRPRVLIGVTAGVSEPGRLEVAGTGRSTDYFSVAMKPSRS
jgi:hypothetical protein